MVEYKERYAKLSGEELLTLAAQEATLVDSARTALQVELSRRRLQNTSLDQYQVQAQKEIDEAIRSCAPVAEGNWVKVIVPRGSPLFPSVCPSCLGTNSDTPVSIRSERENFAGYRVLYTKFKYLVITIPHCRSCARRFILWQRISSASILVGMLAALVISLIFKFGRGALWLLIVPFCSPGILASIYLKRSVRLADYDDKWLDFRFKSFEYANLFHRLNSAETTRTSGTANP
jgi:hypothetical protein